MYTIIRFLEWFLIELRLVYKNQHRDYCFHIHQRLERHDYQITVQGIDIIVSTIPTVRRVKHGVHSFKKRVDGQVVQYTGHAEVTWMPCTKIRTSIKMANLYELPLTGQPIRV